MIDYSYAILLFAKDITGGGADKFYWFDDGQIVETDVQQVVELDRIVVCHDFWLIRDVLFDKAQDIPELILDLDEFRITISGDPKDRILREKQDITNELIRYGTSEEVCSQYKKMFYGGEGFDIEVALEAATAMDKMFCFLCEKASVNDEMSRFLEVELPVYRLLQRSMASGICINSMGLKEKRSEAEHDYFYALKNYSATHDMPLETPAQDAIEAKLNALGFDLNGVSTNYVLEFLPHEKNFGNDTISLLNLNSTRQVLSSLSISSDLVRPVIDVFGSRTSRVHLRSPSLQNLAKKYRTILKAREGANLSYVDFDQYEVGIMAALSEDPELARLYETGDMYDLFATQYLGLDGNRKAAKQLFLSYAYGMSRDALVDAAVSFGADRKSAKSSFKAFTKYEEWKNSVWSEFRRNERIGTLNGNYYKRDVYDLKLMSVDNLKRLANSAASLVIVAMVSNKIHVRIFDEKGKKVIDKSEKQISSKDGFTEFCQQLKFFYNKDCLSFDNQQEVIKLAMSITGYSRKLSGKEKRSAVSQVVQGTASLIFKKSLLAVSEIEDVTIVLPMHDALLFEHNLLDTPNKVVEIFSKVMTEELSDRVKGKASIAQFS
ncbi:DNA polymerase [Vreelandella lutescens]|uniref:DNA-directed DNA polymerase n=1 Tax=Vreelandella lutescens TaxID=1602943 RepID=A0ABQ1NQ35_9GAMM|nr:DNA polymerase [Halomonas lutescens]GGC79738.1 hypothetical protein GCM10011382_07210 [Halomonas lutescens]